MTAFFDTVIVRRRLIYQAQTQQLSPPPPFPNGWMGDFRETFAKPFPVTEQQFWAGRDSFPGTAVPALIGWFGEQTPQFAKPFPVIQQQFWTGRIDFPGTVVPAFIGWSGYFPEAFSKPFPVIEQQFWTGRDSFPGTVVPGLIGWFGEQTPQFARPFPAALQQFWTERIDFPTSTATPQGWPFQQPDLFVKPFIQLDITALGFPAPPTPQGWVGDFGWKFSVPINAALQQFWSARLDPAAIPGATPGPTGWVGYQPEEFGKALNAALQQYVAFQPQGPITSAISVAIDPWYPDPKLLKKLLDRLKANQALRWKQLSQPDKRRIRLRAAVEMAYHGITEERKAPTAKAITPLAEDPAPVVKAVKALGVTVQRRDYDFIINSVREYEKQAQFDRDDEEDVELLLLQI